MFKSASRRFAATLFVSVLGFALTLCAPDGDPPDSPLVSASLLPPPQR